MDKIKKLPFHLQYILKYKNLSDEQINSIRIKLVLIIVGMLLGAATLIYMVNSMYIPSSISFNIMIGSYFILGFITILVFRITTLEPLEDSGKENIKFFNKLKKKEVATNYLQNNVLNQRSIYIFDQILMTYLIEENKINKMMVKAQKI